MEQKKWTRTFSYDLFEERQVKNINAYNEYVIKENKNRVDNKLQNMPYIIAIIGNMAPVPVIYLFARKVLEWGKDRKIIGKFFSWCLIKGERWLLFTSFLLKQKIPWVKSVIYLSVSCSLPGQGLMQAVLFSVS